MWMRVIIIYVDMCECVCREDTLQVTVLGEDNQRTNWDSSLLKYCGWLYLWHLSSKAAWHTNQQLPALNHKLSVLPLGDKIKGIEMNCFHYFCKFLFNSEGNLDWKNNPWVWFRWV